MHASKNVTMGLLVLSVVIWSLPLGIVPVFHMGATAWAEDEPSMDYSAQVAVGTANARSRLDRRTRLITSEADVTLTHQGSDEIPGPLWAVIDISAGGVAMPDADGTWSGPDGDWATERFYFDLSGLVGEETFAPGDTVTFHVKFVRNYRIRFTYHVWLYGPAVAAENRPPVADAGQNINVTLMPGQTETSITLDGSASHDDDGSIDAYRWTGTPDPDDVAQPEVTLPAGRYDFTLVVTDDQGAESAPDIITVVVEAASPHAPVISLDPEAVTVDEGQSVSIMVTATDEDGDPVTLSASPRIDNAVFTAGAGAPATGTFSFAPDHGQQGIYTVAFTARDPYGYTTTRTAQITVINVNRPPQITVASPEAVNEGGLLIVTVNASDPDGDPLVLSADNLPPNAIFVAATGTLTFAPGFDQAGMYNVTFSASDGQETASQEIVLAVNDVPDPSGHNGLTLEVDTPESPTLLPTARITGRVNGQGEVQAHPIQTSLITALSPTSARQGQTLDIILNGQAGGDFPTHFADEISQVNFGKNITVNSVTVHSPTEMVANITIDPNAATGNRGVTVTTGSETAVSLPAFTVTPGQSALSGTLVDPETGRAISGAIVTIQGTGFTVTTGDDGTFSFNGVPPGDYTVIVNAPDHELRSLSFTVAAGSAIDLGTIETAPTVAANPADAPPISVINLLQRGIGDETQSKSLEEARQIVIDALLLVGGIDIGVTDQYGNQLNQHIEGLPFISLRPISVDTLAQQMLTGERVTLGEMVMGFTQLWQWKDESPPRLIDWMKAIQHVADRAWESPNDPRYALLFLLFNPGRTISPQPPQIVPDLPLNALQAQLMNLTLLLAASRTLDPELLRAHVAELVARNEPNRAKVYANTPTRTLNRSGASFKFRQLLASLSETFVSTANADDLMAWAERHNEKAYIGSILELNAGNSTGPEGATLSYQWEVTHRPSNSTAQLLTQSDQQVAYFFPDVAGTYTVELTVEANGQRSFPYVISIVARHWPCSTGEDAPVDPNDYADRSWADVFCEFGAAVGGVAEKVPSKIAEDTNKDLLQGYLKNGIITGNFSLAGSGESSKFGTFRSNVAKSFIDFIEPQQGMHSATIRSHARSYEQWLPEIMNEAKKLGTPQFRKLKYFAATQLVNGVLGMGEDAMKDIASQMLYGLADIFIDMYLESARPAPPEIVRLEVHDNPVIEGRKMVKILFLPSATDSIRTYTGAYSPAQHSGQHYFYSLWRESSSGGLERIISYGWAKNSLYGVRKNGPGPRGPFNSGEHSNLGKDVGDSGVELLYFVDTHPPEGHVTYYLQCRRIIGEMHVVMFPDTTDADLAFEYLLDFTIPQAATTFKFMKKLSDRAIRIIQGLKLQDSHLSERKAIYVPHPFERPAPPVSLASTPESSVYGGRILASLPIFNYIAEINGGQLKPLIDCGFVDPFQVGVAVDSMGNIYSDNAASDERFGGHIFRWTTFDLAKQWFGSVNYFSNLLGYAHPCAVQALACGFFDGHESLLIGDTYTNSIRELIIPPENKLPLDPRHYASHVLFDGLTFTSNTSMTLSPVGDIYVSQGNNIAKYNTLSKRMLFRTAFPFNEISGFDFDKKGQMYIADFGAGAITAIPPGTDINAFAERLTDDAGIRSLYTLKEGLDRPGELRLTGDNTALAVFDATGFHFRTFGLSARIVDAETGAPLGGAIVTCQNRGDVRAVRTDQHGVFHMPGLRLPGHSLDVSLLIRHENRAGTYQLFLDRHGETILESLPFIADTMPSQLTPVPVTPVKPPPPTIQITDDPTPIITDIDPPRPQTPPTVFPNIPPAPVVTIISPADGQHTNRTSVTVFGVVSGKSITSARLFVNGAVQTVAVENGIFSGSADLNKGINRIWAEASQTTNGVTRTGSSDVITLIRQDTFAEKGSFAGIVRSSNGDPIPGILVQLQGTAYTTTTDSLGVWRFKDVPLGVYSVDILP